MSCTRHGTLSGLIFTVTLLAASVSAQPAPDSDLAAADLLVKEAAGLLQNQNNDEAALKATQALEIRSRILGKEHADVGAVYHLLSQIQQAKGDYVAADSYGKRAWGIREKALGKESPAVAESLTLLGRIAAAQNQYAEAETYCNAALAIGVEKAGAEDLSGIMIVFPGKRPAHFVRRQIGSILKKSFIPPQIVSIDDAPR